MSQTNTPTSTPPTSPAPVKKVGFKVKRKPVAEPSPEPTKTTNGKFVPRSSWVYNDDPDVHGDNVEDYIEPTPASEAVAEPTPSPPPVVEQTNNGGAEARRKLAGKRKWELRGFETEAEAFEAHPGHYTKGMSCERCGKTFRAKTPRYLHDTICDGTYKVDGAERMRQKKEKAQKKNDIVSKIQDALKLLKIDEKLHGEIENKTTAGLMGYLNDDHTEDWSDIMGIQETGLSYTLWTDRQSIRDIIKDWIESQPPVKMTTTYNLPGVGKQSVETAKGLKQFLIETSTNTGRLYGETCPV
ncbi:MAG: hypothetical protein ACYSUK_12865 [Planctomycetota bacterium]|jgi:hypothetical protein